MNEENISTDAHPVPTKQKVDEIALSAFALQFSDTHLPTALIPSEISSEPLSEKWI